MSLINKEIGEFTVQAYHEGAFRVISKADVLGKWAVFFSIRRTLPSFAPRNWRIWPISMRIFRQPDARCIPGRLPYK